PPVGGVARRRPSDRDPRGDRRRSARGRGPVEEMTASLRIGCSGWQYKDWREIVYPVGLPQRRWFEHYQQLFDTVELNSTFYRLPAASTVEGWASAARPGFLFAVKLGAFGSHRMKLNDAGSWLPNHLDRVIRLGEHLG